MDQLPSGTNGHPVRRWCLLQKNVIQVYYRCEVVALTLCDAEDECHLLVFSSVFHFEMKEGMKLIFVHLLTLQCVEVKLESKTSRYLIGS